MIEQTRLGWSTFWRQRVVMGGIAIDRFLLQVLDHRWIFNAGNDFDVTAAVLADFDIDIEDPFESLHPGHGVMLFLGIFVEPAFIG